MGACPVAATRATGAAEAPTLGKLLAVEAHGRGLRDTLRVCRWAARQVDAEHDRTEHGRADHQPVYSKSGCTAQHWTLTAVVRQRKTLQRTSSRPTRPAHAHSAAAAWRPRAHDTARAPRRRSAGRAATDHRLASTAPPFFGYSRGSRRKCSLHLFARRLDAGVNGLQRRTDRLRDFGKGQFLDLEQHERDSLRLVELAQRVEQESNVAPAIDELNEVASSSLRREVTRRRSRAAPARSADSRTRLARRCHTASRAGTRHRSWAVGDEP